MKKLLVALLVLGALSFVPSAEAGRNKKSQKSCAPCEKKKPRAADTVCTTRVVPKGTTWSRATVPAKRATHHFCEETECITTKTTERPYSECDEPVCLEPGEQLP